MLDDVIEQVRSEPQDAHRRAIVAWAQTKDRTRLKILAATYRASSDAALRRLALEAHTHAAHDPHAVTEQPGEDESYLSDSVNAYIVGDKVRAVDTLNRALRANPAWKADPVIADFSAMLLGISPEKAVKLLAAPGSEDAFNIPKGAGWWQLQAMREQHITPAVVVRNLILLVVVAGGLMGVLWWVFTEQWVSRVPRTAVVGFSLPGTDIATVAQNAGSATGALGMLVALAGGAAVADALVRSYAWHMVAGAFVDSKRSPFLLLLHRVVVFHLPFYVLTLGALCILFLLSADTISQLAQNRMNDEILALNRRVYVWSIVAFAIYTVIAGRILMDTYRLEIGSGILLLIIGLVTMVAISALVGLAVGGTFIPSVPGVFG